ncbi:endonuclease domain-containing protein [Microbacterium sp. GXF7504]
MRRADLPPELGHLFASRAARGLGVPASRLGAADLDAPFHGVRRLRDGAPASADPKERMRSAAAAYAHRMTAHEFFCGVTAAVLWGLPLPLRVLDDPRVHVAVRSPRRAPRGRGVRGREVDPRLAVVVTEPRTGFQVTDPATTWAMLAPVLRHPYDLVAVGDAIVRVPFVSADPTALATLDDLGAAVDAGRRVGVNALRAALPRIRDRAASRPETWMRLTVVDARLPEPLLNHDVFDAAGRWLARVDAGYPAERVALEYEGEHHLLDPAQWAYDLRRYERLAAAGWHVVRVSKDALFQHPGDLIARVRRALAAR